MRYENLQNLGVVANDYGEHTEVQVMHEQGNLILRLPVNVRTHLESVLSKRHELTADILGAITDETTETKAIKLHNALASELLNNSICALANGSIQTTLEIFNQFIRYLIDLNKRDEAKIRKYITGNTLHSSHLHTLLFLWLGKHGPNHGIVFHDIQAFFNHQRMDGEFHHFASVHHLILTCVYNLTKHEPLGYAPLNLVFEHLATLGFQREKIIKAIEELCHRENSRRGSIELVGALGALSRLESAIRTSSQADIEIILANCSVHLTLRGSELISNIYQKVGYMWQMASRTNGLDERAYFGLSELQRVTVIAKHLMSRARIHLRLVYLLLKDDDDRFGKLSYYRRTFGVNGETQIERSFESAGIFYSAERHSSLFAILSDFYSDRIKMIIGGIEWEEIDLESRDFNDITSRTWVPKMT